MRELNTSLPILILLGILVFIYHFGVGIYYARGLEPYPRLNFFTPLHFFAASFGG